MLTDDWFLSSEEAAHFVSIGTHVRQFEQNDYGIYSTLLIISLSSFLHSELPKNIQKRRNNRWDHYRCSLVFRIVYIISAINRDAWFLQANAFLLYVCRVCPPPFFNKKTHQTSHYFWQSLTVFLQTPWIISAYFKDQFVPPVIPDVGMKPKFSYLKQW